MEHWITEIMDTYGYLGIFLLIALENLFPPIPSEVILTFGGFMTTTSNMTIIGVILAATAGSVVGAICLYGVGRMLSVSRLETIITSYGKILRLKPEDIRKAHAWFDKYGARAVFFGRLVPLIRSLISIPAGSTRMSFLPFLMLTTLGSLIWNIALVYIGAAVGASWESIVSYMDIYSNVVYILLALSLVVFGFVFVRKRILKKNG
ncbi:alkaline phosphatase-like protein [Paenibacillus montaniterrae]|uniref:Alkaline phosphatase-like protein n=1 Tax=Paenibacillus montaniterrae TaxID=429341 RepID=A0A919YNY9_9BACL|nr:DedA family protein [Paenibacillus montaniterrae]GIP15604.1 alkaline phosphatase-like protein [Paenibacillus montaniterrae]